MIQTVVSLIAFMVTGALGFLQFDGALILPQIGHVIILGMLSVSYIVLRIVEGEIRLATKRLYLVALSFEFVVLLSNIVYEIWIFDKFLSSDFMMKLSMILLIFPAMLINITLFGLMRGNKKEKLDHGRVKKDKEAPIKQFLSSIKKSGSKQEEKTKDVFFVLGVSADNDDKE